MAKFPTTPGGYVGLDFSLDDMRIELRHLRALATTFIDDLSGDALQPLIEVLQQIRTRAPVGAVSWTIPKERPLRTIVSKGDYEPGSRTDRLHVYAEVSGDWQISVPNRSNRNVFRLDQLASIAVKLRSQPNGHEVKSWHFDIADAASTGCHFHTQVGDDLISVPRLPTFFLTPADVVDFVLGELFQDAWQERVGADDEAANGWRRQQNRRLTKLLRWHQDQLRSGTVGWAHLKKCKPSSDLLLS